MAWKITGDSAICLAQFLKSMNAMSRAYVKEEDG
jgi:hypothetical protein